MDKLEQCFYEAIPKGCEHAQTARELQQITGFDAREQRNLIENLRTRDDKMIAGGNFGYFIPELDCKNCKAFFKQSMKRNENQSEKQANIANIQKRQMGNFQV